MEPVEDGRAEIGPTRSHRGRQAWAWALTAVVLVAVGVVAGRWWLASRGGGVDAGDVRSPLLRHPAPAFVLPDLDDAGRQVALSGSEGRPVVMNVWESWCVPCRKEMPALEELHRRLAACVTFLGVDHADTRAAARQLVAETGVTYRSGYDPGGTVAARYGLFGLPSTIVVDGEGVVRTVHLGPVDADRLARTLTSLVAEAGASC